MAEYCAQCSKTCADIGFLTPTRNGAIVCEGCGHTVVDSKGRCTGGCGTDAHNGIFTDYIFETAPPKMCKVHLIKRTPKTILYKLSVDSVQLIPRAAFLLSMVYLLSIAIYIKYWLTDVPEKATLKAELSFFKANTFYTKSLDFWYRNEMKIEEFLFH